MPTPPHHHHCNHPLPLSSSFIFAYVVSNYVNSFTSCTSAKWISLHPSFVVRGSNAVNDWWWANSVTLLGILSSCSAVMSHITWGHLMSTGKPPSSTMSTDATAVLHRRHFPRTIQFLSLTSEPVWRCLSALFLFKGKSYTAAYCCYSALHHWHTVPRLPFGKGQKLMAANKTLPSNSMERLWQRTWFFLFQRDSSFLRFSEDDIFPYPYPYPNPLHSLISSFLSVHRCEEMGDGWWLDGGMVRWP